MNTRRTLAICALCTLTLACGGAPPLNSPDPYEGVVDPTGFDLKFQPISTRAICGNNSCYPVVKGWAHGRAIYFYELGGVTTSSPFANPCPVLPPPAGAPPPPAFCVDANGNEQFLTSLITNHVYEFHQGDCNPDPNGYDVVSESYDPTQQYPVMTQLPLGTATFNPPVVPIAGVTTVTGVAGDTCNDIKNAASVDGAPCGRNTDCASGNCSTSGACVGGRFGATTPTGVDHYALYGAVDMDAVFPTLTASNGTTALTTPFGYAWSGDLQTGVMSVPGQKIAFDSSTTELAAMDGIITDPGAGKFAKITDQGTILLPAAPGEAGFSPIVRLHDYSFIPGESIGTYRDLCTSTGLPGLPNCTQTDQLDIGHGSLGAFNTIFIVAVSQ